MSRPLPGIAPKTPWSAWRYGAALAGLSSMSAAVGLCLLIGFGEAVSWMVAAALWIAMSSGTAVWMLGQAMESELRAEQRRRDVQAAELAARMSTDRAEPREQRTPTGPRPVPSPVGWNEDDDG